MKKILYILITFGVIGGGVFGGILSEQVPKSTYNVLSFSYLAIVVLGYIILFGKKKAKKTATTHASLILLPPFLAFIKKRLTKSRESPAPKRRPVSSSKKQIP